MNKWILLFICSANLSAMQQSQQDNDSLKQFEGQHLLRTIINELNEDPNYFFPVLSALKSYHKKYGISLANVYKESAACNETLLLWATQRKNSKLVGLLVKQPGVDVNLPLPDTNFTPLMIASAESDAIDIVTQLLEANADVTKVDKEGRTAYDIAYEIGNTRTAELLKSKMGTHN